MCCLILTVCWCDLDLQHPSHSLLTHSQLISHWFHLSLTLSCTLNRSLHPKLQPCSGCGRGRGWAWGKVAEEGGEVGEAHSCGLLIESQQFGQWSPNVWEWSGICHSWLCLHMWNRDKAHLCQCSCLWPLRLTDCACSFACVFMCVCLLVINWAKICWWKYAFYLLVLKLYPEFCLETPPPPLCDFHSQVFFN